MAEFELIQRLAELIPTRAAGVSLSIGDDAALLQPTAGQSLVAATDTLNEGVHFAPNDDPAAIGHKALAVNLSDLAAMGARPRWVLLNLSLPNADPAWLDAFAKGFSAVAKSAGVVLVGGDTCTGPRSISVTVLGEVPLDEALRRDGAVAGDLVFVSGTLGDAAFALQQRQRGKKPSPALARALDYPQPALALGAALRGLASSCIDLSDGLLSDLGHVATASGLRAELSLGQLPASAFLQELPAPERWQLQLTGGEDYGLCFTVPREKRAALEALLRDGACAGGDAVDVAISHVGELQSGSGVRCFTPEGAVFEPQGSGWEHFAPAPSGSARHG